MLKNKNLLIVGGTGRDVGKTEFVCRLIKEISTQLPVYSIKVSSIFPGEELYHGTHSADESKLHLFEETNRNTKKDTARMLNAGSTKVFYLRADDMYIPSGFNEFVGQVPERAAVVCESNSLGQHVKPALSIMVRPASGQIKPRSVNQLECADLVVISDGASGFSELASITFSETEGWKYQPC